MCCNLIGLRKSLKLSLKNKELDGNWRFLKELLIDIFLKIITDILFTLKKKKEFYLFKGNIVKKKELFLVI